MAYSVKNIIVGAAALYVSKLDSSSAGFYASDVSPNAGQVAVALPGFTAGESSVLPTAAGVKGAFEASTDWNGLGFTSDGIELSYEPTFGEVNVDQLLDAAKMFKSGMKASVKTTLAEATLENLIVAWGQRGDSLVTVTGPNAGRQLGIAGGALYDEPIERSLAFIGPAPRGATNLKQERVYHVRRALNVEASTHSLKKSDATNIPVSLRLLPDPYYSGKEYGIILDRATQA